MKHYAFTKEESLRKESLIKDVFRQGIPIKGKFVKIYLLETLSAPSNKRAAFLVVKALCKKKAVLRNRYRRCLKEAYRNSKNSLKGSFDIIILLIKATKSLTSKDLELDIDNVFKRFGKKYDKILS